MCSQTWFSKPLRSCEERRVAAYVVTKPVAWVFIKITLHGVNWLPESHNMQERFTSAGFAGVRCVGNVQQGAHGEGMFCRRSLAWGEGGNLCLFSELSQCFSETPTLPATVGRRERQQRYGFLHRRALRLRGT